MRARTTHSSKIQPVTVALIAFAYFVIVVLALYFLNPAYSLLNSFAGNYDLLGLCLRHTPNWFY